MNIVLLLTASPYQYQATSTALRYCNAAIKRQHRILLVYFYFDGVYQLTNQVPHFSDEHFPLRGWQQLADNHPIKLGVCHTATERRGINHALPLPKHFKFIALHDFIALSIQADKLIQFGPTQ